MKRELVILFLGFGLAGCGTSAATRAPNPPATDSAMHLAVRRVAVSRDQILVEVHIYPDVAVGKARLTLVGKGIQVSPPAFTFRNLKPPPKPDTSRSPPNPPPLPRTIIRVFRVTATAPGPHELRVRLHWSGGSAHKSLAWTP